MGEALKVVPDTSDVTCIICRAVGKWQNVDRFRYKPQGMCMCEVCGFVSYPEVTKNQEKLKAHYEQEYRQPPTVQNLFSSERKLHYHIDFLKETLQGWEEKKKNPCVLEIGAAMGLFLNWFRGKFPGADLNGTELTTSFVRTAFWLYRLELKKDADWTKKYDLIMSYKVAEHMPDIDVQLKKYRDSLADDGLLYISVPQWFGRLNNFGLSGFSLEYYYDKNHCNAWSRNLFELLLERSGFRIVKENHWTYDSTYLCVKGEQSTNKTFDDPAVRLDQLERILKAAKLSEENRFKEAVELWPDFPDAQQSRYEIDRKKAHALGWEGIKKEYLDTALAACPNDPAVLSFVADVHMRYEKFNEAIDLFSKVIDLRPPDVNALNAVAHCLRQQASRCTDEKMKIKAIHEAMKTTQIIEKNSLQARYDAMTWIMHDASNMPTPFEAGYENMYKTVPSKNEVSG